jgi:hypothetical protein
MHVVQVVRTVRVSVNKDKGFRVLYRYRYIHQWVRISLDPFIYVTALEEADTV